MPANQLFKCWKELSAERSTKTKGQNIAHLRFHILGENFITKSKLCHPYLDMCVCRLEVCIHATSALD